MKKNKLFKNIAFILLFVSLLSLSGCNNKKAAKVLEFGAYPQSLIEKTRSLNNAVLENGKIKTKKCTYNTSSNFLERIVSSDNGVKIYKYKDGKYQLHVGGHDLTTDELTPFTISINNGEKKSFTKVKMAASSTLSNQYITYINANANDEIKLFNGSDELTTTLISSSRNLKIDEDTKKVLVLSNVQNEALVLKENKDGTYSIGLGGYKDNSTRPSRNGFYLGSSSDNWVNVEYETSKVNAIGNYELTLVANADKEWNALLIGKNDSGTVNKDLGYSNIDKESLDLVNETSNNHFKFKTVGQYIISIDDEETISITKVKEDITLKIGDRVYSMLSESLTANNDPDLESVYNLDISLPANSEISFYSNGELISDLTLKENDENADLIDKLDDITTTNENGYIEYDGKQYKRCVYSGAKVDADIEKNGVSLSRKTSLKNGVEYYFRVEPISWRVLSNKDNKTEVLSEKVLFPSTFGETTDYSKSYVREFLNNDFYTCAFTDDEKAKINTVEVDNSAESTLEKDNKNVCENTSDKVYLLSLKDLCDSSKGFIGSADKNDSNRIAKLTDYACFYSAKFNNTTDSVYYGNSYWMLRSPSSSEYNNVAVVSYFGSANMKIRANSTDGYGVRPAITINK